MISPGVRRIGDESLQRQPLPQRRIHPRLPPRTLSAKSLDHIAIEAHRIDPRLHRVLAEQIPRTGRLKDVETFNREAHALFREYLAHHRHELAVGDLDLAAFLCASAIEAVAHNAVLHRGEVLTVETTATLVEETTRLVLGYLQPSWTPAGGSA